MLTHDDALAIATDYVAGLSPEDGSLLVLDEHTQEHDFGWVFFYCSSECADGGTEASPLAGNAALILDRESGQVVATGTAMPLEVYLARYRAAGDPLAVETNEVVLSGWHPGANKVQLTKAIKARSGVGLKQAKECTDAVLSGRSAKVMCKSVGDARLLAAEASGFGFDAKHVHE